VRKFFERMVKILFSNLAKGRTLEELSYVTENEKKRFLYIAVPVTFLELLFILLLPLYFWGMFSSYVSIAVLCAVSGCVAVIGLLVAQSKRINAYRIEDERKYEHYLKQQQEKIRKEKEEMKDIKNIQSVRREFIKWLTPIWQKIGRTGGAIMHMPYWDYENSIVSSSDLPTIHKSKNNYIALFDENKMREIDHLASELGIYSNGFDSFGQAEAAKVSPETYLFLKNKSYLKPEYKIQIYSYDELEYWYVSGQLTQSTTTYSPSASSIAMTEAIWGTAAALQKAANETRTSTLKVDGRQINVRFKDKLVVLGPFYPAHAVEGVADKMMKLFPDKYRSF